MISLHMEGWMVSVTKMCEGYTWRSDENVTESHTSYMWNITKIQI